MALVKGLRDFVTSGGYDPSMRNLRPEAEKGDASAQYALAQCLVANPHSQWSRAHEDDLRQAVYWFRKAGTQGHSEAQLQLGLMYQRGIGVGEDDIKSVSWMRKAAEAGNMEAQCAMGVAYAEGHGVSKDKDLSITYFTQAHHQGSAEATYQLAVCHRDALGTTQDHQKGMKLFCMAASLGHKGAIEECRQHTLTQARKLKEQDQDDRRSIRRSLDCERPKLGEKTERRGRFASHCGSLQDFPSAPLPFYEPVHGVRI